MTWNPNISTERREAIGRAGRAVVRLAVDTEGPGSPPTARTSSSTMYERSPTARRGTPWPP